MSRRRWTIVNGLPLPHIAAAVAVALATSAPDLLAQEPGPDDRGPERASPLEAGAEPAPAAPDAPAGAGASTKPVTPVTMDGLLARLAAMPGLSATFREEKRLALLAAPLVNEGTLHYTRQGPDGRPMLARHTLRPSPSTVLIDDRSLQVGDAQQVQRLDLAGNPVLRQFLDSFLPLLRGDKSTLEAAYRVRFQAAGAPAPAPEATPDGGSAPAQPAEDGAWTLTLRPRSSPMKDAIERIEFRGEGLVFERMLVAEVGGDETVTTFSDVDVERRYTPAEAARVFRLPAEQGG